MTKDFSLEIVVFMLEVSIVLINFQIDRRYHQEIEDIAQTKMKIETAKNLFDIDRELGWRKVEDELRKTGQLPAK